MKWSRKGWVALAGILMALSIIGLSACQRATQDFTVTSSEVLQHTHKATITGADVDNPPTERTITTTREGTVPHTHTITLTREDFESLKQGSEIVVNTSTDNLHSHSFTLKKPSQPAARY